MAKNHIRHHTFNGGGGSEGTRTQAAATPSSLQRDTCEGITEDSRGRCQPLYPGHQKARRSRVWPGASSNQHPEHERTLGSVVAECDPRRLVGTHWWAHTDRLDTMSDGWRNSQITQAPAGSGSPRRRPPANTPPNPQPPSPHAQPDGSGNVNFERGSGGGSGLKPLASAGGSGFVSKQMRLQQQQQQAQGQKQGKEQPPPQATREGGGALPAGAPPNGAPPGLSLSTVYQAPPAATSKERSRKSSAGGSGYSRGPNKGSAVDVALVTKLEKALAENEDLKTQMAM